MQLLELAQRAHVLFQTQPPREKRKLLNFLLWNCTWRDGELTAKYRQPFDILAVAVKSEREQVGAKVGKTVPEDSSRIYLAAPLSFCQTLALATSGAARVD